MKAKNGAESRAKKGEIQGGMLLDMNWVEG